MAAVGCVYVVIEIMTHSPAISDEEVFILDNQELGDKEVVIGH